MSLLPFILIMICLLTSCKNKVQAPGIADRIKGGSIHTTTRFEELPEDFRKFYIQFHEDSVFQMNSIFFRWKDYHKMRIRILSATKNTSGRRTNGLSTGNLCMRIRITRQNI